MSSKRIPAKSLRSRSRRTSKRPHVRTCEPRPSAPDDEAGLHLTLAAVVLNDHPRRPTRFHRGHPRAATHLRARIFRRLQQDVLHLGVVVGEDGDARQAGRGNVAVDDRHAAKNDIPPAQVVADRAQQLVEANVFRLGHAPRHQHLAAHAVVELERALEHEDTQARPR